MFIKFKRLGNLWTNSKLNSFTKSFGTSSNPVIISASANRKNLNPTSTSSSSVAKSIANNLSSISNYSLSLAANGNNNRVNTEKNEAIELNESCRGKSKIALQIYL